MLRPMQSPLPAAAVTIDLTGHDADMLSDLTNLLSPFQHVLAVRKDKGPD